MAAFALLPDIPATDVPAGVTSWMWASQRLGEPHRR
jgi:hypothetical protein